MVITNIIAVDTSTTPFDLILLNSSHIQNISNVRWVQWKWIAYCCCSAIHYSNWKIVNWFGKCHCSFSMLSCRYLTFGAWCSVQYANISVDEFLGNDKKYFYCILGTWNKDTFPFRPLGTDFSDYINCKQMKLWFILMLFIST